MRMDAKFAGIVVYTLFMIWLPSGGQIRAGDRDEKQAKSANTSEKDTLNGPNEVVIVTAARAIQDSEKATSLVTVIESSDLEIAPVLVLDEALRQIPGFSLFRRSSSLSAHPTTQGVSLRGIGPSGTSRSLVLLDGVPLNDPFGGWIYWNRVPFSALDRIEVVRGASSQLYGSSALGGVIQLVSRRPEGTDVRMQGSLGNLQTYDLEATATGTKGPWGYLASGRILDTGGFYAIDDALLGAVDRPVTLGFQSFFTKIHHRRFWAGLNFYNEDRGNGTELQTNHSRILQFDAGIKREGWDFSFYTQSGVLESQFSRIQSDRSKEIVTANQRFPSSAVGLSASRSFPAGMILGADWRYVAWDGNSQALLGFFGQRFWSPDPRIDIQLGARLDLWNNRKTQSSLNPRAGLLFRAAHQFTLRGAVYKAFRAPTLNELYRPFRVGNVITDANPDLEAEDLWGGEAGLDFHPLSRFMIRANTFWNRLSNPVGNATVSVSPSTIRRLRRNLGQVDVKGFELDGRLRLSDRWSLRGAYLNVASQVSTTGNRLPQVPRHQISTGLYYAGTFSLLLQGRWASDQYEDDLNQMVLKSFGLVDIGGEKPVGENLAIFLRINNLLNRRFVVGLTPAEKLGEPRIVLGGLRLSFF